MALRKPVVYAVNINQQTYNVMWPYLVGVFYHQNVRFRRHQKVYHIPKQTKQSKKNSFVIGVITRLFTSLKSHFSYLGDAPQAQQAPKILGKASIPCTTCLESIKTISEKHMKQTVEYVE